MTEESEAPHKSPLINRPSRHKKYKKVDGDDGSNSVNNTHEEVSEVSEATTTESKLTEDNGPTDENSSQTLKKPSMGNLAKATKKVRVWRLPLVLFFGFSGAFDSHTSFTLDTVQAHRGDKEDCQVHG